MCQGLDVIQNPSMDGSAVIEKKIRIFDVHRKMMLKITKS
jgi:hypothetical protein